MKSRIALLLMASLLLTGTATAGPKADALGRCLAENTTGKDRKQLARWVFVGMAAHPDMEGLARTTEKDREQASMATADLFTRLIAQSCSAEARSAYDAEGGQAFQSAFGTLGRLAMQELMSDADVNRTMSLFEKFLDKQKLNAAFGTK